jgi:phage gp36-like protein
VALLTQAELEARCGADDIARLADYDADGGEQATAIATALADAEAEVLGHIAIVASLPLPEPAPEILKRIAAAVARYNLHRRNIGEDHPAYLAYSQAVRELQAIAAGRIALPLPSTGANAATASGFAVAASTRQLTDALMAPMLP